MNGLKKFKKMGIILIFLSVIVACGKNGDPAQSIQAPSNGEGLGKVVVADANANTIGVLVSTGLYVETEMVSLKGYFFTLDKSTGKILSGQRALGASYKKGTAAVAGGLEDSITYHNASDCSDANLAPSGVLYVRKNNWYNNIVVENNNQLFTFDSTSYNAPIHFNYVNANGVCSITGSWTGDLVTFASITSDTSGVKLSYPLPLRLFYNNVELKNLK